MTLNEAESKAVLRAFGVPVAKEVFVAGGQRRGGGEPASSKAPFAVKVVSRDVPHKTEAGGVKLGVAQEGLGRGRARWSPTTPRSTCRAPRSTACWCRRWRQGLETLIGVINDPSFGPMVALGLGGVFTEVLKDVDLPRRAVRSSRPRAT